MDVAVSQPSGFPPTDCYQIVVRGQAGFDVAETEALTRRFVLRLQTGPLPASLDWWRAHRKSQGHKTSAPSFILLGPQGGVVYPQVHRTPKTQDEEAIRRCDGSASFGSSSQLDGGTFLGWSLGFNVVDTSAPTNLAEPTVFIHGAIDLLRTVDPGPIVDLLSEDLRALMSDLSPFVHRCEIAILASVFDPTSPPAVAVVESL